jgi:hypothetical protein
MKTRKKTWLTALLSVTLLFAACEKKELNKANPETAKNHQLIQRYSYQGETFQIEYNYNEKNELVNISGDVEAIQAFQSKEVPPSAYLIQQDESDKNIYTISVFEDLTSMNTYQSKQGMSIPEMEKQCTDWTSSGGTANFRFYKDANYSGLLSFISTSNQSYFQRDFYSAENDKVSSLKLWGSTSRASLDIFEHGCFSGKTMRFVTNSPGHVVSIPNLTNFTFEICTDVIRDQYGNYEVYSYPCGNWNDKISSVKGWSL